MTLRRALAADWVRAVMETGALSPGTAKVAVAGSQLTGELVRTVTELSLRNRYVDVYKRQSSVCTPVT